MQKKHWAIICGIFYSGRMTLLYRYFKIHTVFIRANINTATIFISYLKMRSVMYFQEVGYNWQWIHLPWWLRW